MHVGKEVAVNVVEVTLSGRVNGHAWLAYLGTFMFIL